MEVLTTLIIQASIITCNYGFSGAPMGSISIGVDQDGHLSESAKVSLFYTPTRQVPVFENQRTDDSEIVNAVLSKDDPNNELFMTVTKNAQGDLSSILINPKAPQNMKTLKGTCTQSEGEI